MRQSSLLVTSAAAALTVCLASALGLVIALTERIQPESTVVVLVGAAVAAITLFALLKGPSWALAGLLGLSCAGWVPVILDIEGVDLRAQDVFHVAAIAWAAVFWATRRADLSSVSSRAPSIWACAFLLYAGISVFEVLVEEPSYFRDAFISWARLAATATLAWLAAMTLRGSRDVGVVILGALGGSVVAIALSIADPVGAGTAAVAQGFRAGERYGGLLNVNTFGIVSSILVLAGVTRVPDSGPALRLALVALGLLGMALARSVGSIVGLALALAVVLMLLGRGGAAARPVRAVLALALSCALAFTTINALRPLSLPTSQEFERSSTYHRVVLGAAGLNIFAGDPVNGVGWRRSDSPAVIGSPEIARALRERFPTTKFDFFPEYNRTGVHNTYIQVLAELGILGMVLLVIAGAVGLRAAIRGLRRLPRGSLERRQAVFLLAVLVSIAVWLNDNPLYGGQPETILFACFAGALSCLLEPARPGDSV